MTIKKRFIFCFISFLVFFFSSIKLSAEGVSWKEVANSNNAIQYIDPNSIKYNNKGLLSVVIKYSEINPEDQKIITTNTYLMVVDCDNRLYSKLPVNGELKKIKNLNNPLNDKLIKKTIINSCSY